ncbi:MAG: glycosyltransferase [Acidobacteriota bacterium]
MSITVCLSADTIGYPEGGGHLWAYLNWALGLRALGYNVTWLEGINPRTPTHKTLANIVALKNHLKRYGLAQHLALCFKSGEPLPKEIAGDCLDLDAASEADLLLNLRYGARSDLVGRFKRTALIDIDPGLLQIWMSEGQIEVARHNVYFTIGETVGTPGARFPDAGLKWEYTPPCVALNWWPPRRAVKDAPFTTVAHWYGSVIEYGNESYDNSKRSSFMAFVELPRSTDQSLELALDLVPEDEDQVSLWKAGWMVRESVAVAATPWDYQRYIQDSRGEFSCVKPSCIRLQNSWISDRTLCYMASGKPAVMQHTGPSRFLPDGEGLFRFRDLDEAVQCINTAADDYEHQCKLARALAEEFFDARKVVERLLERAMT